MTPASPVEGVTLILAHAFTGHLVVCGLSWAAPPCGGGGLAWAPWGSFQGESEVAATSGEAPRGKVRKDCPKHAAALRPGLGPVGCHFCSHAPGQSQSRGRVHHQREGNPRTVGKREESRPNSLITTEPVGIGVESRAPGSAWLTDYLLCDVGRVTSPLGAFLSSLAVWV